jgi:glycine oxidase
MSLKDQHIAIAGAGIIGLSAALAFADAGARVTVFDRGRAMQEASWAAAGMLAVDDPENDPLLLPLSRLSRALYSAFLDRVEHLSGMAVPLRTLRTLQGVAHPGPRGQAHMPALLEGLTPDAWSFYNLDEASLDPRDLCAALPRAARAAGVTLREHTAVHSVSPAADGAALELTLRSHDKEGAEQAADAANAASLETCVADHVVLAAGAWSGYILFPGGHTQPLPVAPRKGQMIEVLLAPDAPQLTAVIRTQEVYLVPRGDRRVVIGATVEDAGFDRSLDPRSGRDLLQKAAALWPAIRNSTIHAEWTGLRPGYDAHLHASHGSALPTIGPLAGSAANEARPRLWAATGHFRNGILLAPATADLLVRMLQGQSLPIDIEPFSPARFVAQSEPVP